MQSMHLYIPPSSASYIPRSSSPPPPLLLLSLLGTGGAGPKASNILYRRAVRKILCHGSALVFPVADVSGGGTGPGSSTSPLRTVWDTMLFTPQTSTGRSKTAARQTGHDFFLYICVPFRGPGPAPPSP